VRYDFPGRRLADGLVDMPFTVPGVVAGITLVSLYAPGGPLGQFFDPGTPWGNFFQVFGVEEVNLSSSIAGVLMAQIFSTLPFVVRTVQPVLTDLEPVVVEPAYTLGASSWQTFWRIVLPNIRWAVLYGVILCTARAVGEFGAVSVVSGRVIGQTNTLTLHVEQTVYRLSNRCCVCLSHLVDVGCCSDFNWSRSFTPAHKMTANGAIVRRQIISNTYR
jgi:sulfate transport system permease protein